MALAAADTPALQPTEVEHGPNWRVWLIILLLALLAHLLLFMAKVQWANNITPAPIEIKQVDPSRLEEIRKLWRDRDKQLLLNKDKAPKDATEAPKDARYFSDRNIHVDKEQRAKEHEVVPKAGRPGEPATRPEMKKSRPAPPKTKTIPDLGALGVPFNIAKNPPAPDQDPAERPDKPARNESAGQAGANQYVDDPRVPVGGENMLNAEESVFYSFYARLYEAIGPVWSSKLNEVAYDMRLQPGEYTTSVDVVLDAQGNLTEVKVLQGSGIEELDQIVGQSWRRIGRFPNPPSGLLSGGEVHTGWNFTVRVGDGGVRFLPPERSY